MGDIYPSLDEYGFLAKFRQKIGLHPTRFLIVSAHTKISSAGGQIWLPVDAISMWFAVAFKYKSVNASDVPKEE